MRKLTIYHVATRTLARAVPATKHPSLLTVCWTGAGAATRGIILTSQNIHTECHCLH